MTINPVYVPFFVSELMKVLRKKCSILAKSFQTLMSENWDSLVGRVSNILPTRRGKRALSSASRSNFFCVWPEKKALSWCWKLSQSGPSYSYKSQFGAVYVCVCLGSVRNSASLLQNTVGYIHNFNIEYLFTFCAYIIKIFIGKSNF